MPTITLNFTAAVATRMANAFQVTRELPAPATEADVKEFIISSLKTEVRRGEALIHRATQVPAADVDVT